MEWVAGFAWNQWQPSVEYAKGDYFVKINPYMGSRHSTGLKYKLAYILTKSSQVELENNDKPISATPIVSGKYIHGYFQQNESVDKDCYKYEAKTGKYTLKFEHGTYDFDKVSTIYISIFDANQKRIQYFKADSKKLNEEFSFDLNEGSYFIRFEPSSKTTGEAYKFGLMQAEQ